MSLLYLTIYVMASLSIVAAMRTPPKDSEATSASRRLRLGAWILLSCKEVFNLLGLNTFGNTAAFYIELPLLLFAFADIIVFLKITADSFQIPSRIENPGRRREDA